MRTSKRSDRRQHAEQQANEIRLTPRREGGVEKAKEKKLNIHSKPIARSKRQYWQRRMSDHIASALLVYTVLNIFVTIDALRTKDGSLIPYSALIILVVAIIPAFRQFERTWNKLSDSDVSNQALEIQFRRDRLILWLLAIGLPFMITGFLRSLDLAFSG